MTEFGGGRKTAGAVRITGDISIVQAESGRLRDGRHLRTVRSVLRAGLG